MLVIVIQLSQQVFFLCGLAGSSCPVVARRAESDARMAKHQAKPGLRLIQIFIKLSF